MLNIKLLVPYEVFQQPIRLHLKVTFLDRDKSKEEIHVLEKDSGSHNVGLISFTHLHMPRLAVTSSATVMVRVHSVCNCVLTYRVIHAKAVK